MAGNPKEVRLYYDHLHFDPLALINFSQVISKDIYADRMQINHARWGRKDAQGLETEVVEKMIAAEFFPDENPPRMVVAESMFEDHKDIRKDEDSKKKRISGNIIWLKDIDEDLVFFSLDPISSDEGTLMTNKTLPEVIEMLLERGYVPLNAKMEILIPGITLPRTAEEMIGFFQLFDKYSTNPSE